MAREGSIYGRPAKFYFISLVPASSIALLGIMCMIWGVFGSPWSGSETSAGSAGLLASGFFITVSGASWVYFCTRKVLDIMKSQQEEAEPPAMEADSEMARAARNECMELIGRTDRSFFVRDGKLMERLGIAGRDDVYLVHDDGLRRSRSGFAVTGDGFVCIEDEGQRVSSVDWTELASCGSIEAEYGCLYAGGKPIASFTDGDDILVDIREMASRLAAKARDVV